MNERDSTALDNSIMFLRRLDSLEMINGRIDFQNVEDLTKLQKRIEDWKDACQVFGKMPTYENLCTALGKKRQVITNYLNGAFKCCPELLEEVMIAKDFCASVLMQQAFENQVTPQFAIFQQKSTYGYHEETPTIAVQIEEKKTKEQLIAAAMELPAIPEFD